MQISLHDFLVDVQRRGLKIDTVFDIGAEGGVWAKTAKRTFCPNSEFFLFEANPAYKQQLADTGFRFFNDHAISNPGRQDVEFFVIDKQCGAQNGGNSYYKENTEWYNNSIPLTLPCTTIDELIALHNLPTPNLIKLDTQGSELDILKGAESIIDKVDMIYTECPIIQYNTNAPNIQDYLEYFKSKRFIPITVMEVHVGEAVLLQVDIMFMREESKNKYTCETRSIRPFT